MRKITLFLYNGTVYTGDNKMPFAEAVGVCDDKIIFVGSDKEGQKFVDEKTKIIDLKGKFMMPGLIDAHFHLLWQANFRSGVCIDNLKSISDLQQRLRKYNSKNKSSKWILGGGFNFDIFPNLKDIHRKIIDEVISDKPVLLSSYDMHTFLANTKALELAGLIYGDKNVKGIVLDDSGNATGELCEFEALGRIEKHIPPMTKDQKINYVCKKQKDCNSFGITSIQNKDGDREQMMLLRELDQKNQLTVRIQLPIHCEKGSNPEIIKNWKKKFGFSSQQTPYLRASTVKVFFDGTAESKTAWMFEPYCDGSNDCGIRIHSQEEFEKFIKTADENNLQVVVHAIGDRAVHETLNTYEIMPNIKKLRHRIEHIEIIDPRDLNRFNKIGVPISVQPMPVPDTYTKIVGKNRLPWTFAWRYVMNAGNNLALGSDYPVTPGDPRAIMHHALTLKKFINTKSFPDHRFSLEEVLAGYTRYAAYADNMENEVGTISPGYYADLAVFDQNPFNMSHDEILDWKCVLTISGGKIVYQKK